MSDSVLKYIIGKHFISAGCSKVKFMSVTNHRVMVAYV